MNRNRIIALLLVLALTVAAAAGGWIAASRIKSPAEVAARTASPTPSPIFYKVKKCVLSSAVMTHGAGRFGLPQEISLAPSALKANAGLITTLPWRNKRLEEGDEMLTASGRPVFVLQGKTPAYRDLVPGISGDDVRQLEQGLERLGFDPGPIDGTFDQQTSAAVAQWYKQAGREPFGPTTSQLANIRTLEQDLGDARRNKLVTAAAAAAASVAIKSARATEAHDNGVAEAALAARIADRDRLMPTSEYGTPLAVASIRAKADYANKAATAEIAAKIADRAVIVLNPRQTRTARAAADAQLELARAAALNTQLGGELAVQAAQREANLAAKQYKLAETALNAAQLKGKLAVQAAVDAQKAAKLDAELAADRTKRLTADVDTAKRKLGVGAPVDEIVFIPALPVRVEKVTAHVGESASGPVLSVTDFQLVIESSLSLDEAALVKRGIFFFGVPLGPENELNAGHIPDALKKAFQDNKEPLLGNVSVSVVEKGREWQIDAESRGYVVRKAAEALEIYSGMPVDIDEQSQGIKAKGIVKRVAKTPGTHGVRGRRIYFEVHVVEAPKRSLVGFPLRLTIPIKSTKEDVLVVPISAVSLAADGKSKVQVRNNRVLEYVVVKPGLSADGFVEVTPVDGTLEPGQLVVIGFENKDK